jgi:hypothetical protein
VADDTAPCLGQIAQLRHLHTLHLGNYAIAITGALFQMRPFPFLGLHSLDLLSLDDQFALAVPVMPTLRRLGVREFFSCYPVRSLVRLQYATLGEADRSSVISQVVQARNACVAAHLEADRTILTMWSSEERRDDWWRSGRQHLQRRHLHDRGDC